MREDERDETACFVNNAMQKAYGCDAYPLPEGVLIARHDDALVGAIAFSEADNSLLPAELIYNIRFPVRTTIQFGRWVGVLPHVAEVLLYEAVLHAIQKNYARAISEIKPHVGRRFRQLGIPLKLFNRTVKLDYVPHTVRPYYGEPAPILCAASLDRVQKILDRRIRDCGICYKRL